KKAARAIEGHGHDLPPGRDGRFGRAELEWPHAGLRGESSFGEDEHGFAAAQRLLDLVRLLQSRAGIFAVECKVPELAEERADHGHGLHFSLRDEMIV